MAFIVNNANNVNNEILLRYKEIIIPYFSDGMVFHFEVPTSTKPEKEIRTELESVVTLAQHVTRNYTL